MTISIQTLNMAIDTRDELEERAAEERLQQEELEKQKQQERQRRRQQVAQIARQQVKQAGKQAAKKAAQKAVVQGVRSAATAAIAAIAPYVVPVLLAILGVVLVILVIIVVLAYLCTSDTWTGTAARSASKVGAFLGILDTDYCKYLEPVSGALTGATTQLCEQNPTELARQYNTPVNPRTEDPQLQDLIRFIEGEVGPMVTHTYDETYPLCNTTRGIPICEPACSHATSSCHYGGSTGSTGALAVDFVGVGSQGAAVLQAARDSGIALKRATCENSSGTAVPCTEVGATHVHISLGSCDRDSGPINTQ